MPKISASDGTKLYVEEAGSGTPVVFIHEYAADYRTWEPQMRHFARSHRCVTYSQRGYPPSDVPEDPDKYTQDLFRDDVIAVMDALKIDKAHVVGHSMGASTALHVGIRYPKRCISVTAAGCGYGSSADPKVVEELARGLARERQDVPREHDGGRRGEIRRRRDPPGAQEQGPARLRAFRQDAERAFARSAMR